MGSKSVDRAVSWRRRHERGEGFAGMKSLGPTRWLWNELAFLETYTAQDCMPSLAVVQPKEYFCPCLCLPKQYFSYKLYSHLQLPKGSFFPQKAYQWLSRPTLGPRWAQWRCHLHWPALRQNSSRPTLKARLAGTARGSYCLTENQGSDLDNWRVPTVMSSEIKKSKKHCPWPKGLKAWWTQVTRMRKKAI